MKKQTFIIASSAIVVAGSWFIAGTKACKEIGIKETIKGAVLGAKDAFEELNHLK